MVKVEYKINDKIIIIMWYDFLCKKTPRQGIEPWFSDLESDVLTIERPGMVVNLILLLYFRIQLI